MFEYTGSRVAFSLFGIDVYWYGILIVIGMVLAIYLSSKELEKNGQNPEIINDLALWVLPAAIIGARLWYVIFEFQRFDNIYDIINVRDGGLAIHGGVIAGVIVGYIYAKIKNIKFFKTTDIISTYVPIAQAIGRWGNFINNEAHGGETNLPWALIIEGKKYHPTFFYESMGNIILFLIIYFIVKKGKKTTGMETASYLIGYGIIRFFVEGLRTDSLWVGPFRVAQLISIVFIILGLIILSLSKNKKLENI